MVHHNSKQINNKIMQMWKIKRKYGEKRKSQNYGKIKTMNRTNERHHIYEKVNERTSHKRII